MPANDGTTRGWYLLIDTTGDTLHFTHHSLKYDFNITARLMERNGLPMEYVKTLRTGIWDNCDILPPEETCQRNTPVALKDLVMK